MTMMISEETFNKIFPHAVKGVYQAISVQIEKAGCVTKMQQAMFLAQCGHESGGFTRFKENLNYSWLGLSKTFRKYFPDPLTAKKYERKPELIANRVYANRLGNGDEKSGDGWKYRGRGLIQITGKDNYAAFRKWLGRDIEPEDVAGNLDLSVKTAVWYWKCYELADLNSVEKVTRRINGGLNGIDERCKLYRALMVTDND
ncbi:TPA: glycoside hydrolase family 19 protein [Haemophilus influenzae]|uniref:glycoside hydrolase family 19 protein n=1 Tax=Haemophilus influenzae TaxID=727 RepID=UPI000DD49ABA|nr:glycoside hydrolase family 19 protein [Haemophilus influenzae]MCK9002479.1 glycoside hydrolase family 19 protein [Haemophilus influenzae]